MDALLQEALPWLVSSNLPHLSSFHVRVLEEIFFKDIRSKYNIIIIPLLRHFTIFGQENAQNMRR